MDLMMMQILVGSGVGVGTMILVALLVVAVLTIRDKLQQQRDTEYLESARRRQRHPRLSSASTHRSEASVPISEHSITVAYNRRSFSMPNGSVDVPVENYGYEPTLQPLHHGHSDPFHHRQVNPEGTQGALPHYRPGSPAIVPFRESRLPSAGINYSTDGHVTSWRAVDEEERDEEEEEDEEERDAPNFSYGLRTQPEPGHRLNLVYPRPAPAPGSARAGRDEVSSLHSEVYEKNWRKYSTSSSAGMWGLDNYRHGPSTESQIHTDRQARNKPKKINTQENNDAFVPELPESFVSNLPRVHVPSHNINLSPSPVPEQLYY